MKLYLVSRTDYRGTFPIKVFVIKDNAKQFCGECNVAVKLIKNSDEQDEISLLKEFDSGAISCNTEYVLEEIQSE